jgi:hypothetical protein
VGQAINAVTGTRLWAFAFPLAGMILTWLLPFVLRSGRNCRWAAVVQGLVHFSAHPQMMQQYRQLSCRDHDGSLLAVSSATLDQFQSPASQITVHPERTQNYHRSCASELSEADNCGT